MIAAVIFVGSLLIALKVQTSRLASVKAEYAGFVAQTKAIGEIQEAKTKLENDRLIKIAKDANNENSIAHTKLADVAKRLRDRDSRRGLVPPATPGSKRPDLACSDRAELDSALRDFAGEAREGAIEGTAATVDLNTGKEWAKELGSR
jgi:hypothetical protein